MDVFEAAAAALVKASHLVLVLLWFILGLLHAVYVAYKACQHWV
jgi:hypothetical protein